MIMRRLVLFFFLSLTDAFHLAEDKDNSVQKDSNEESSEWVHAPIVYDSEELQWLEELSPVPAHDHRGDSETYQWLDDDVVQKLKPIDESQELITLPGGCELTKTQYQQLKDFRKDVHYVQKCYCHEGSVYCKLKKSGSHVQVT